MLLQEDFKKTCYIWTELYKTQAENLLVSVEANFVSVGCEGSNLCCALPSMLHAETWWLAETTSRPDTHATTNIKVCLQDNWPADRQKTCYHALLTSLEIDSDMHKIFCQYIYASLPEARLRPNLHWTLKKGE